MKKILLICVIIFIHLCLTVLWRGNLCMAQNKINFPLRKVILNPEKQNQQIHFAVQGNAAKIKSAVKKYGGVYKYDFRTIANYSFVSLPATHIDEFAKNTFVERIEFTGSKGVLLNDTMRANMNVNAVHQGALPLIESYDGVGVLIGIIDAGIELQHPDFLDSLGKTRVVSIWDQTMPIDAVRTPIYGYGQVWDNNDINQQNPNLPKPQTGFYGHGSHVSAIAGGNGNADSLKTFKGMAPNANYIVVSSDFYADDWLQTVADAVDFIFQKADEMGKPCVINISAGTYSGSHDGKDIVAQYLNQKDTAKSGRAIVCAAGNAGTVPPFHLRTVLSNETKFTWFKKNDSFTVPGYAPNGAVYFELFADTAALNNINFSFGADKTNPGYELRGASSPYNIKNLFNGVYPLDVNGITKDTLKNANGETIAKIFFAADLINDSSIYALYVLLATDSSQYNFRFTTTGTGNFDVWSTSNNILAFSDMVYDNLPPDSTFPDIANYVLPDTNQSIVSSFSCATHVITVGNYTNRHSYVSYFGNQVFSGQIPGSLYSSSSIGPTRDNRIKPDITASGAYLLSASDFSDLNALTAAQNNQLSQGGFHREMTGTSMSSPAVAGLAALFFQKCNTAEFTDLYNALTQNTRTDSFTGNVPNNFWGYGKADALQALASTNFSANLAVADSIFCPGSVKLSVSGNFSLTQWNNGTTGNNTVANQQGNYFATVTGNKGCRGRTDTAMVVIDATMPSPLITALGQTYFCNGDSVQLSYPDTFVNYVWSNGKTSDTIFALATGFYKVTATANNGCNYPSDSMLVWAKPSPPVPEIFQSADTLVSTPAEQYQWYLNGNILQADTTQNLIITQSGFYQVEIFHVNGCAAISDSLFAAKTSTVSVENANDFFHVFPNPNDGKFLVSCSLNTPSGTIKIYNVLGETVYTTDITSPETRIQANLDSGVYYMKITSSGKTDTHKIILHSFF